MRKERGGGRKERRQTVENITIVISNLMATHFRADLLRMNTHICSIGSESNMPASYPTTLHSIYWVEQTSFLVTKYIFRTKII